MKTPLGSRWLAALVVITSFFAAAGATQDLSSQDASQPPCSDCHVCRLPTTKQPCLEKCLRQDMMERAVHTPSEGPDVALLDQLRDMYEPVRFNHKLHAEMVGLGEGCGTCHHYSPATRIPPCRECHGDKPSSPVSLRQPGLKGAYHRQCMGCHREWNHDTKCVLCHLASENIDLSAAAADSTDIAGIAHPLITLPVKKIYDTPYKTGPKVTFYHNEHIDRFDLRCVSCHKRENCAYCHYFKKAAKVVKTDEEVHAICNDCHANDNCSKCHDVTQKPPFAHATADWKLAKYHAHLQCRNCHPTGKRITTMNAKCVACHAGWNQDNFRHAVTGLRLDETHRTFDCENCHIDLQYHTQPGCDACHDDGRIAKQSPPGEYVKQLDR